MKQLTILTILLISTVTFCGTRVNPSEILYNDEQVQLRPELITNSVFYSNQNQKIGLSYNFEVNINTVSETAKKEDQNIDTSKFKAQIDVFYKNQIDSESVEAYAVYKTLEFQRLEIYDIPEYKDLSQFIFYALIDKVSGELKQYKVPATLKEDVTLLVITQNFFNQISPDLRSAKYQITDTIFTEEDHLGKFVPQVSFVKSDSTLYIEKIISDESYIEKKIQESDFPLIFQVRTTMLDMTSGIITSIKEAFDFSMNNQLEIRQNINIDQNTGSLPGYDDQEEIMGNVTGHTEYYGEFIGIIDNCEELIQEIESIGQQILVDFDTNQLNNVILPQSQDEYFYEMIDDYEDQEDENTIQKLQQTPIFYHRQVFFDKHVIHHQLTLEAIIDLKSSYFDFDMGLKMNNQMIWPILRYHKDLCASHSEEWKKEFSKTLFQAHFSIGPVPVHFHLQFKMGFGARIASDPNCKVTFTPFVWSIIQADAGIGFHGVLCTGVRLEGHLCNTQMPMSITPFADQSIKNVHLQIDLYCVPVRFVFGIYYKIVLKHGYHQIYDHSMGEIRQVIVSKTVRLW